MAITSESELPPRTIAITGDRSLGSAWYALGVLNLVYVFSFIDRSILNLLVAPVRRDLGISDTGMSLLTGFSFAVFYTLFGLPLSRFADSHSRRGLIGGGFAVWSLFAAGCGLARNFFQMVVMRMGVGIGEASLSPAAYSLIYDYFPKHLRSTALSLYVAGSYIGIGVAYVIGGIVIGITAARTDYVLPVLGSVRSWQVVFFAVGLPGLLFVPLLFTFAEPARTGTGTEKKRVSLREAFAYFAENRTTFLCLILGAGMVDMAGYGAGTWIPSFYIRHHHWTAAMVGQAFGLEAAILGPLGLLVGGRIADRLAGAGHHNAPLLVCMAAQLLSIPAMIGTVLVASVDLSIALLGVAIMVGAPALGCVKTVLMEVTPARLRSQAGAVLLFSANLIGLGMGASAVALLTDRLFHDDNLVGYSILIVASVASLAAIFLFACGRRAFLATQARLGAIA
jgi:MFS family permease